MQTESDSSKHRVLLLTTTRSYRGPAFLAAADKLNVEIIQGIDMPDELASKWADGWTLDFRHQEKSIREVVDFARDRPLDGILAVDDSGTLLAARASAALDLPHNSPEAAAAAANKYRMRQLLHQAGLPSPIFHQYTTADDPEKIAVNTAFPCVIKPTNLNGSRGVIRANNQRELINAIERCSRLLESLFGKNQPLPFLVESYISGNEVALEGLMDKGQLHILAIYDKPDPLEGPFFEETIYVTPSQLSFSEQSAIKLAATQGAKALGLKSGPVHAELRINEEGPWIIEIAGRSIGGLCSQTLLFGIDTTLEELILRQLCSLNISYNNQVKEARGVMMIPVPSSGLLRGVSGVAEAEDSNLIDSIEITARLNYPIVPVPEGDGYLGFIFARGQTPELVENALREAHSKLDFQIDPLLPILTP